MLGTAFGAVAPDCPPPVARVHRDLRRDL
ncbi:uncharacterized protein METZ01_LOCUS353027, partial [marine metagenome]